MYPKIMTISKNIKIAGAVAAAAALAGVVTIQAAREQFGTTPRVTVVNLHGERVPSLWKVDKPGVN